MKKRFRINLLFFLGAAVAFFFAYSIAAKSMPTGHLADHSQAMARPFQGKIAQVQVMLPENIQWRENPEIAGVESAIALGNPSSSELYVLFGRMAPGSTFPAHSHPDDRITTVISGVMYYGIGETFNPENVQAYPAGSVVYTPAGTPHFMQSQDAETLMQETGFGPTGLTFQV
ncbi:MAG: cupin domain-containing protein [Cyanobacteria bacterium J06576_12]